MTCGTAAANEDPASTRDQIEAQIIPAVTFTGNTLPTLAERRTHYGVPTTSLAVIRDGKVAWTGVWGEGVSAQTVYQAASLCKAVSTAAILSAAMAHGVAFDEDIAPYLSRIDLDAIRPAGTVTTLAALLSHTAGASVSGYPGYASGSELPGTVEIVTGSDRTNTQGVTIEANPEGNFAYSGGGYQIAQLMIEDVTGEPFSLLAEKYVFKPLRMNSSTYEQPLSADFLVAHDVASGNRVAGVPVDGGWHVYPEQAAAGLWTTPADYARFSAALMGAAAGASDTGLSPTVAKAMLTQAAPDYGIGVGLVFDEETGERRLQQGGSTQGYKTFFAAWPDRNDAIVVMSNSDSSALFNQEIVRSAAAVYGWPAASSRTVTEIDPEPALLEMIAGTYETADERFAFSVAPEGNRLRGRNSRAPFTLAHLGEGLFIDVDDGAELTFRQTETGWIADDGTNSYTQAKAVRP
nr:serine hydrolase [Aquisalinus flavus]